MYNVVPASNARSPHYMRRWAILLSGERRTFDRVRQLIEDGLLRELDNVTVFDCSDVAQPPLAISGRSIVDVRIDPLSFTWPSSAAQPVLTQLERNHICWESVKRHQGNRPFDVIVRTRPDMAVVRPLRLGSLVRLHAANMSRILLARARCWPDGKLPRAAWTYGHTRCGGESLADDAFFVVGGGAAADAVFSRPDEDLLGGHLGRDPRHFPRCNASFKAAVIVECVFSRHLHRRGMTFVPTSLHVGIARASPADGHALRASNIRIEGHSPVAIRRSEAAAPTLPSSAARLAHAAAPARVPRLWTCATSDRRGVCRVALAFATELVGEFLRARCSDGIDLAPVHVIVGCDNAPALNFTDALAQSPHCRARFAAHARAYAANAANAARRPGRDRSPPQPGSASRADLPSSSGAHRLAIMVLKEPAALSQRFYKRSTWGLSHIIDRRARPGSRASHGSTQRLDATLVVDSFGSLAGERVGAAAPCLVLPWAAVSYASRGRRPSELLSATSARSAVAARHDGFTSRFCTFLGHRADPWGVGKAELRRVAPGYLLRDALIRQLNCTQPKPGDRMQVTWKGSTHPSLQSSTQPRARNDTIGAWVTMARAAEGPTQVGPFESAVSHYSGSSLVLAVENTDAGGPISEKIINAYLAGAIPVTWGGVGVHASVFNPMSFVDCAALIGTSRSHRGDLDVGPCVAAVRAVQANATRLAEMRASPPFASRADFERLFAWSEEARGSQAQRSLHSELERRLEGVEQLCAV